MPKSSSSCQSQAQFGRSLPHSDVGFHLGLLEPSEISVDKDLHKAVLLKQTTGQSEGNQTALKTGGSLAKVKKTAPFSPGGGKDCFGYSNPACPGLLWNRAPMHGKHRVFISKTNPQQHRKAVAPKNTVLLVRVLK